MPVTLNAGQPIDLPAHALSTVRMVLTWRDDPSKAATREKRPGEIPAGNDLDASALLLDAEGNVLDTVWFRQNRSDNGAVMHSGDDTSGEGNDDESITVNLPALDDKVQRIVFLVNNYNKDGLSSVQEASCRLIDEQSGQDIASYNLNSVPAEANALIMAMLTRTPAGWQMKAIGAPAQGGTYWDTLPEIKKHL